MAINTELWTLRRDSSDRTEEKVLSQEERPRASSGVCKGPGQDERRWQLKRQHPGHCRMNGILVLSAGHPTEPKGSKKEVPTTHQGQTLRATRGQGSTWLATGPKRTPPPANYLPQRKAGSPSADKCKLSTYCKDTSVLSMSLTTKPSKGRDVGRHLQ